MRKLRSFIDNALPFVGVLVILGAMLMLRDDIRIQIVVVGVGMLMIELGVWKFGHKALPNERRYSALRTEVDQLMKLVRDLNTAALAVKEHDSPETRQAFQELQEAMQQTIARLSAVAGKTDAEVASQRDALAYQPRA